MDFDIREKTINDQDWLLSFMRRHWGSETLVTRNRVHQAGALPGFIATQNGNPVGIILYHINKDQCEILLLQSLIVRIGIGSALIEQMKKVALTRGCRRLWLITTNDNQAALRFYQLKGFALVAVYPNAMEESRKLKPEIPSTGSDGIPIRDEIELEFRLSADEARMNESTRQFYDLLAKDYHLIFNDWSVSVERQAQIIHALIQTKMDQAPQTLTILDCSCGIGTQAIGLAKLGYLVTATDLSPKAVERAGVEAEKAGVQINWGVADFCHLAEQVAGLYDVILSFDNSLPHLLEDWEYSCAFQNIHGKLQKNGLLLASIRDYDQITKDRPTLTTPSYYDNDQGKRVSFQVWEWADCKYTLNHFIIKKTDGNWDCGHRATQYRAILRRDMNQLLEQAGFQEIEWRMPEDSGFYQPIVTAHKR